MFATRYLHFIDQSGLSVWARQGNGLQCLGRFTEDSPEAGPQAFAHWLAARQDGVHHILLDLPDEGFHVEQIPPVSGKDRKALLERRQLQQFFGTPYATSISLGRSAEGRRDERVLLVALTRPAALDPWLQCLRQIEARIAAVSSVALLTKQLLQLIEPDTPQGLILNLSPAGIRQTYFEQGSLRFSRLSPAPDGALRDWGEACLREAQKTAQYLMAQRWITRGVDLPVWLLVRREDFPALADSFSEGTQLNTRLAFRLASIDIIAHQAGIRTEFRSSDSSALMLHLALRDRSSAQLAPVADRRFFKLWRVRNTIATVGICAGVVLSLMALGNQREALNLATQDRSLSADLQADRLRYQQLLASLPAMPTSLETLQAIVDRHAALLATRPRPEITLKQISQALETYPDVMLQGLAWKREGTDDKRMQGNNVPPKKQRMLYTLDASLPDQLDARTAITRINAFAATLQQQTGGEIIGLKLPFDSEPDKTLHSDALIRKERALFQVRLRMPEDTR